MKDELNDYLYRGARNMVLLHEMHMRSFLQTWNRAKDSGLSLPETDDPDYESMETLLRHVLGAARSYMTWMCEKLDLPDPEIDPVPDLDTIIPSADSYLDHLLRQWRSPLKNVPTELFGNVTYTSRWGIDYCVDAMLEHAVMHPIRHQFQLEEMMEEK